MGARYNKDEKMA